MKKKMKRKKACFIGKILFIVRMRIIKEKKSNLYLQTAVNYLNKKIINHFIDINSLFKNIQLLFQSLNKIKKKLI